MLKLMRDSFQHLKWILLAVVAAFVFGFVFIDMGLGGADAADDESVRAYAARVNGETISYQDYNRALYFAEENYKRMYGGQFTPEMAVAMGLNRQVLDSLIDQRLLLQEARRLDLGATPEEIRKRILAMPALNPDGRFVGPELYGRFVTLQLGYQTPADFESDLAREITLEKIESALASAIVISAKAADAEYRRTSENAKIRYILYPVDRAAATLTVTPQEVEQYYRANQAKYAHGEQRSLQYLLADLARLRSQIVPTEQELLDHYNKNREQFRRPDSAHVLHILIKSDVSATPEQDAAARAKAEALVAQLRAGADFAKLARENSEDPSSAANGGDMGFVDRGQTVDAFEQAIFSIPLNQISDAIKSQEYGYHIVKVVERRPAGYREFAEVREQIANEMATQRSKDQATQEIARISARVKQKKPADAAQFSALANTRVSSNMAPSFQKGDQIPGLGSHQQLAAWAFAANVGDVSEPIGTPRGPVVARLSDVRPAGVSPLAEVRAKVENDVRLEKARGIARQQLAQAMAGAANLDAVSAKLGLTAAETTVGRQGFVSGIPGDASALVEAAFAANVGEVKGPVIAGDSALVFQVTEQKRADATELAKNRPSMMEALRQREARALRAALLQRLRKNSKVEINKQILEQTQAQQTA